MKVCIRCGSDHCVSLRRNDPSGIKAYWFASLKGSEDFLILMSDLKIKYITSPSCEFPSLELQDKYDWYCSQCFLSIMYKKKIAVGDWVNDTK